jgi:uncharacterized glyoxalase superfamily protein PhnB
MPSCPPGNWPRLSAAIYYDDPAKAIDWLCKAFGFEVRLKIEGSNPGEIVHSELVIGHDALIMVSASDPRTKRASPRSTEGMNTQALMLHVEDVEAHCARARAAGAVILQEPQTSDYGEDYWADRTYEAQDLEGHRWWIAQRMRDVR